MGWENALVGGLGGRGITIGVDENHEMFMILCFGWLILVGYEFKSEYGAKHTIDERYD